MASDYVCSATLQGWKTPGLACTCMLNAVTGMSHHYMIDWHESSLHDWLSWVILTWLTGMGHHYINSHACACQTERLMHRPAYAPWTLSIIWAVELTNLCCQELCSKIISPVIEGIWVSGQGQPWTASPQTALSLHNISQQRCTHIREGWSWKCDIISTCCFVHMWSIAQTLKDCLDTCENSCSSFTTAHRQHINKAPCA